MKRKNQSRGNTALSTSRAQAKEWSSAKQQHSSIAVDEAMEGLSASSEGSAPAVKGSQGRAGDLAKSAPVDREDASEPEASSARLFTRERLFNWVPFWAVILLGAILRFWGLGDKPLHHDESLHAYFSMGLMHDMEHWQTCVNLPGSCYHYDPLLHGPFQFHAIALVYKISQILGAPDHGINTTTVRIAAALLGTLIVALPFFLRDYLGKVGAWLACFLLAVSPSMVYFSRFAREDIYMACFTLLMVVSIARYVHTRKMRWLILTAAGLALSYATKEATFLSIAVFGSFLGALIAWELGLKWRMPPIVSPDSAFAPFWPKTWALVTLGCYFVILAPIAKFLLGWMGALSIYVNDPKNQAASDAYVQHLKDTTVALLPWLGIALGLIALACLIVEMLGILPTGKRFGLAKRVDPERQPLLDTIVTMPWTHWFFAILAAVAIFMVLFTVLFTYVQKGIGDGIWQGLYYWIQQQQVARGGQPWYYYFLLIPLYEQIGVVFGIVGIVRSLLRPSPFRLFLIYWFVGNVFIYSWAGEKMPWLMIHMTMPLMLLAAIGLEPLALKLVALVNEWRQRPAVGARVKKTGLWVPQSQPRWPGNVGAICGALVAVFLLVLTLQNMFQVTYIHAADGPHEMMIYVQTTPDVNIVMSKIEALDQKYYGGKHLLPIGVTPDAQWPFYWYLRDYTNVCYTFPGSCATLNPAVIISAGATVYSSKAQYATATTYGQQPNYLFQKYELRTWWDEGYKPPPCVVTKTNSCQNQPTWGGVGPFLWMDYGDTPPAHASFDLGAALQHLWDWWWQRKPFGSTMGGTDMGFLIRRDLGMTP